MWHGKSCQKKLEIYVLGKAEQPTVNGFACRCGGVIVVEIDVMGFLPWVMGLLIGVVAWLSVRLVVVFCVVLAVGFSWWLSAWVSLSDSCGGCFFVAFLFCFLWLFFCFLFFFF